MCDPPSSDDTDSDRNNNNGTYTPPKKKSNIIRKHRAQKFRQEWMSNPSFKYWLAPVENNQLKAKCLLCKTELIAETTVLKNHLLSAIHKKNNRATENTNTTIVKNFFRTEDDRNVKLAEIKICAFFAAHNIPFLPVEHLIGVLKDCFPDSKIAQKLELKRTKATSIITNVIGEFAQETLIATLKTVKFSLLIDETTDIATIKTMCIVVRYFDKNKLQVLSSFLELLEVHNKDGSASSAENLFNLIITFLSNKKIPIENIIGFGSDGCNTMMGIHNSVASRLKEICPGIIIMTCICHSLHLCSSEACKQLPRSCEDLARNVYNFFKNSSKRLSEYQQFQLFAHLDVHRLLHPAQTRWLSLTAVVTRLVEQWPALVLYFNEKWLQERLIACEQIYKALNDPFIKLYFYFLEWILPKITVMNELFQSEKVLIADLHEKMCCAYKDILLCYMKRSYVLSKHICDVNPTDESNFLEKCNLYLGLKVMNNVAKKEIQTHKDLLNNFYMHVINFLKTLCLEIKKRFNFKSNLSELHIFNPRSAMSHETRDRHPTLLNIFNQFHRFTDKDKYQNIDDEWRNLPTVRLPSNISLDDEIDIFWGKLQAHNIANDICEFVLNILSIPHSNAECERIFSKINLIKTKTRNKLITKTINGTLSASQLVKKSSATCCVNFKLELDMIKKFSKNMYNFNKNNASDSDTEDVTFEGEEF